MKAVIQHLKKSATRHETISDIHDHLAELHKTRAEDLDQRDPTASEHHRKCSKCHVGLSKLHADEGAACRKTSQELEAEHAGDSAKAAYIGDGPNVLELFKIDD